METPISKLLLAPIDSGVRYTETGFSDSLVISIEYSLLMGCIAYIAMPLSPAIEKNKINHLKFTKSSQNLALFIVSI